MKSLLTFILALCMSSVASAGVVTQTVDYKQGDAPLKGYLAYDDSVKEKRPGVLVVHEWWGLNDYAKKRAEQLAKLGYVAFAVDMYGGGAVTTDREKAAEWANSVRGNSSLMRERAKAGLAVLAANERVDPDRIGAIGFCFGGTVVLELAYSGADLAGVVSFHGGLVNPKPEDMKSMKSAFLVLHGAEDPFMTPKQIAAFQGSLEKAGVDWQMVYFGGAVHAFSNQAAGDDKSKGVAYDAKAARRSWEYMQLFFREIFAR